MDWLFDTYAGLVHRLVPYYETLFPKQEGDSSFVWRSTIRAKACDDIRGLLPAATRSSVGIFASGQAYETMLIKMRANPLAEVREYADLMLTELRKVIPSFMRRVDVPDRGGAWTGYLAGIATDMNEMAARIETSPEPRPEVALVEWDDDAELKIAAAALYPYTDLPDDQILDVVSTMSGRRAQPTASRIHWRANQSPAQAGPQSGTLRLPVRYLVRLRRCSAIYNGIGCYR